MKKEKQKPLTAHRIIGIFGLKKQTPDECILKLAMDGIVFTPSLFVSTLKTTVLDIAASNDDYVIERLRDPLLQHDRSTLLLSIRNSLIILGNIARIIKYTTEFNNAVCSKSVIPKIQRIQKHLHKQHLNTFAAVSDLYEGLSEIIEIIQDKKL